MDSNNPAGSAGGVELYNLLEALARYPLNSLQLGRAY